MAAAPPKSRRAAADRLLDGLIASKLAPPQRDPRAIAHPALVDTALAGLPAGRLVAIAAPAGSGKSSLMTELHAALGARGVAGAWLSLDADENDPATFARYFISAVQAVRPGYAQDELIALGANPSRDFEALFARLAARLAALDAPAAIFLDDFQHLLAPVLLRFFERLLAHLPPTLSFVIASRHRLPLALGRLLVAGQLVEVDQDALNFDRAQTEAFLARYHQLALSAADIDSLLHATEGWPTGVQLAALALRRHRGDAAELLQTFSGRDRELTRYLVESVLRAQPPEVRRFLLHTSPLRRMCAELCTATTDVADSRRMLDELAAANLFLIALDREGRWHRYHHLFAEFLQHAFRAADPAGYREVCQRAARWYEAHGQPGEAIRYALAGEHHEQAADLIARHALQTSLYRGDHYTLLDWLRVLPPAFHARHPEILLAQAWSCAFSRDTRRAMAVSQQAIDALSGRHPDPWSLDAEARERWLLWALNVQAATKACSDDIDDCVERADALLPQVPACEPLLIATLSNCLSYGHFARRDFTASRAHALVAREQGHRAGSGYLSAWGEFLHGLTDVEQGELRAAGVVGRRVHRDSQGLGLGQRSYVAGLAALLDTEIAVQRGDDAEAARHIEASRAFKDIFGPVEPQLVALRCEARLLARDDPEAAARVLQEGQDGALREQHPRLYRALALEEAGLRLSAGAPAAAEAVVRRARLLDETPGEAPTRGEREPLRLLDARLRLAAGEVRAALRLLTAIQQARGAEDRGGLALAVTSHRAIALWQLGRHDEAARQLDRALVAAAPEGHLWPIAAAGQGLLPILDAIGRRRGEAAADPRQPLLALQHALLRRLRGAGADGAGAAERPDSPGPSSASASAPTAEPLTERERELLRLLQAGLSNRALADALLVSVPTIKWHLHNVYEKLGVGSRGAAVAAATRLGLAASDAG